MANTFYLKRRDTLPVLQVTLLKPDDTAFPLDGIISVTMHVHLASGNLLSRVMTIASDLASGIVTYAWLATDWTGDPSLVAGTHRMEFEARGPGTERLTFPNSGFDFLRCIDDLGQALAVSVTASPAQANALFPQYTVEGGV